MIDVKDNLFCINSKEKILFGGEMHYFRIPKQNWKIVIRKIKEAGCNLISTYIPWCWHEQEEGKFDFTGITREERDLKAFLELIKEENMYCIVRPGPYVMSEIKYEGMPQWLIKKYPEIIARTIDGKEHPSRVVSYMHPIYLAKVKKWYEKVCEIIKEYQIYDGGNIIMFQLDNEVGMLQWVTNLGDYSENVRRYFEKYLENKYFSLALINEYYGISSNSISDFINKTLNSEDENVALKINNDYSSFIRLYYRKYVKTLKKYAKDNDIKIPFIVNIHGFTTISNTGRGNHYSIGLSQLYEVSKLSNIVLAGDYYIRNITYDNYSDLIIANAFTRAIQNENQPLFSAEFQGGCLSDRPRLQPSDIDLSTRVCFGSGMNAINYYMFASGENFDSIGLFGRRHEWQAPLMKDGKERPHYKKIQYLGGVFKTLESELIYSKRVIDTYVGFYPDYYMTEYKNKYTEKVINEIENGRDCFQFDGIIKSLCLANISFEAIDLLKENKLDSNKIKSLWVYCSKWMDERVQNLLVEYVKSGGKLLLYPMIPEYNLKGEKCVILKNEIDCNIKGIEKGWQLINIKGMDSIYSSYRLVIDKYDGEPIAWYEGEFGKEICGFSKKIGSGKIVMLGVAMEHDYDYKVEMIKKIAQNLEVEPVAECSDLWTNVLVRNNGDTSFVFINNFDETDKNVTVKLKNNNILEDKNIYLKSREGVILPINYEILSDFKIIYSTLEIFNVVKSEDIVEISFKIYDSQKGEVFIETTDYKAIEQEGIRVINLCNGKMRIYIEGRKENVKISFTV